MCTFYLFCFDARETFTTTNIIPREGIVCQRWGLGRTNSAQGSVCVCGGGGRFGLQGSPEKSSLVGYHSLKQSPGQTRRFVSCFRNKMLIHEKMNCTGF